MTCDNCSGHGRWCIGPWDDAESMACGVCGGSGESPVKYSAVAASCEHRSGGEASIANTCADCGVDFGDLDGEDA